MKRSLMVLLATIGLASGAIGAATAHADEVYPPKGSISVSPNPATVGSTVSIILTGFCSNVTIVISGPTPQSFVSPKNGTTFTAGAAGDYTITASGEITCAKKAELGAAAAEISETVSASLRVNAVQSGGPVTTTTSTTAAPTTTAAAVTSTTAAVGSAGPVAGATTSSVASSPSSGALPTTGSDSSYTLQLALALLAGGAVLVFVARFRRQQRTA